MARLRPTPSETMDDNASPAVDNDIEAELRLPVPRPVRIRSLKRGLDLGFSRIVTAAAIMILAALIVTVGFLLMLTLDADPNVTRGLGELRAIFIAVIIGLFAAISFTVDRYWKQPRRLRDLVSNGIAVSGTITATRSNPHGAIHKACVDYTYQPPGGSQNSATMRVHIPSDLDGIEVGQQQTILYDANKPSKSIVYCLCDYEVAVEQDEGRLAVGDAARVETIESELRPSPPRPVRARRAMTVVTAWLGRIVSAAPIVFFIVLGAILWQYVILGTDVDAIVLGYKCTGSNPPPLRKTLPVPHTPKIGASLRFSGGAPALSFYVTVRYTAYGTERTRQLSLGMAQYVQLQHDAPAGASVRVRATRSGWDTVNEGPHALLYYQFVCGWGSLMWLITLGLLIQKFWDYCVQTSLHRRLVQDGVPVKGHIIAKRFGLVTYRYRPHGHRERKATMPLHTRSDAESIQEGDERTVLYDRRSFHSIVYCLADYEAI